MISGLLIAIGFSVNYFPINYYPKKKNWIDFNKHLTPKKIKKKISQMEVSSWSRISLWLCLETSVLHVLACSHAIFLFSFCTNPLSKGIRIFFSFLFFLSWILHKAPLKRCWRILKGVALVSSLFFSLFLEHYLK